MKRTILLVVVTLFLFNSSLKSDEGMWIPILIEQFNIKMMQEKGFKLTAEDIYSVNKACMKDAVMIFGGGCTGELISDKGLLITNHHCGFRNIQSHSSLENDYITNGFWAMSQEEELTNPGLGVTFLKYMEDVTEKVNEGIKKKMTEEEKSAVQQSNIADLVASVTEGNEYSAFVRPFYMGNQFFLFVNETYRDVRLVGAPPAAIGNFGSDTDNWVWPRHTGDFSLFRIYADKDNKPAAYSEDNVPYKPAYHFPISLKGVHEGDFTMVFGYPGGTQQYVPSHHIDMLINHIYPNMIDVRTAKLDIIVTDMEADRGVRIKYASKRSGISNSWKRWIGEMNGMTKLGTIQKKKDFEQGFSTWVAANKKRNKKYGHILPEYEKLYADLKEYRLLYSYSGEIFGRSGIEAVSFASRFAGLVDIADDENRDGLVKEMLSRIERSAASYFKNYNMPTDQKMFVSMLELYGENVPEEYQSEEYKTLNAKFNGEFGKLADAIYSKSIFTSEERSMEFTKNFSFEKLSVVTDDPLFKLGQSSATVLNSKIYPTYAKLMGKVSALNKEYMTAQLEYAGDKVLWPDANFTLRVSYGNIGGYDSRDAVYHTSYTTLKGIMEKDNPEIYDYNVPEKLRELYRTKDYGRYAQDGEIPVCFIANNHTTGGNSGSPVINGEGHLIGVNFDRAWEGVMSDFMFNPTQSRNISLDIRYALFLIDKFAGAGYLIEEMTLVE
jgi:hypothetical protein